MGNETCDTESRPEATGAPRNTGIRRVLACLAALAIVGAGGAADADTRVRFSTDFGWFDVWLLDREAPETVANFLRYVDDGDYLDGIFHRSIPGFVLQGGGYGVIGDAIFAVPTDPPVPNEFRRSNTAGTLSMAKSPGNPDSATSQFFLNLADNGLGQPNDLDGQNGGFTVFGCAAAPGLPVPRQIEALPVVDLSGSGLGGPFSNTPVEQFEIGVPIAGDDLVNVDIRRVEPAPEKCSTCNRRSTVKMSAKLKVGPGGDLGKARSKPKLKLRLHGDHWTAKGGGVDLRGTIIFPPVVPETDRIFGLTPDACGMEGLRTWLGKMASKALGRKVEAAPADEVLSIVGKLNRKKTRLRLSATLPVVVTNRGEPVEASLVLKGSSKLEKID